MKLGALISLFISFKLCAAEVHITLQGVTHTQGYIQAGIFTSASSFPEGKPLQGQRVAAQHDSIKFSGLEPGTYAIAVFHDANANLVLDRDWLGIPTEAYAFSRNARGYFSAPEFEQAAFELSERNSPLHLNIQLEQ